MNRQDIETGYQNQTIKQNKYNGELRVLLDEQDQVLDNASIGIQNLKLISNNIGREVSSQNQQIVGVTNNIDRVDTKLFTVNKSLRKLINDIKKDKCCMSVLILIFMLSIVMVLLLTLS